MTQDFRLPSGTLVAMVADFTPARVARRSSMRS